MKRVFLSLVVGLWSCFASASVLTGDTILFQVNPGVVSATPATVGAGDDLVFANFRFNLDAGGAGDQFSWSSTPNAGALLNSTSIQISDLDFNDGSTLIGFDLFSTLLSGLVITTTSDSITFAYTTQEMVGPGLVLSGRFLTSATVPLPGTAPLLLVGIALLAAQSSRRKRGAKV
jgi:hypothetical protein